MKKFLLSLSLVFVFQALAFGQDPQVLTPEIIRSKITERGLNVAEVEARLKQKGFDINNIQPEQAPAAEAAFNEVVREMQAEKPAEGGEKPADGGNNPAANPATPNPPGDGQPANPAAPNPPGESPSPEKQPDISVLPTNDLPKDTLPPTPSPEPSPENPEGKPADSDGGGGGGSRIPARGYTFGQQIFREQKLDVFMQTSEVATPNDYVLGPGDKLTVSVWSSIATYSESLVVEADGTISPKGLPKASLKGMSFTKAKSNLRALYSQRYPVASGNFEVALSSARSIDVTITGEVFNFGSFKISALNNAFHALVVSGGPTNIGTVRNIQLFRSGSPRKTIDVYKYLIDPSVGKDFYLQNGDNLYVGPAGRIVQVNGGVKRPHKYELIQGENLRKLIEWAGGLKRDAYLNNIQITRLQNQERKILDVNLKEILDSGRDLELVDGDIIAFKELNVEVENFVDISGAVFYPERYALADGTRVNDVLKKAQLKKDARLDFASLIRTREDGLSEYYRLNIGAAMKNDSSANVLLKPKDRIIVFNLEKFMDRPEGVQAEGALRNPRSMPYDVNKTLRINDLVLLSGGLRPDAMDYGYIFRTFPDKPKETSILRVQLRAALENPGGPDDILLEPGDRLTVPAKSAFVDGQTAQSTGSVRNPREVPLDQARTMKVGNLIELSNGLLPEATDFAYIFRTYPDKPKEQSTLRVNLKEVLANPSSDQNYPLEPGDRLFVPNKSAYKESYSVQSSGAVRNPQTYPIDISKTMRVSSLLELSQGLQPDATNFGYIFRTYPDRPKEQTTIRVDFSAALAEIGSAADLQLEPGDRLFVPNKSSYLESYTVSSSGAVRNASSFTVDYSKSMRVSHLIELSQGLKVEATDFAYIFRTYPDKPKEQSTLRVSVREIMAKPNTDADLPLEPGDRLFVPNKTTFLESYSVSSGGAVRNPSSFPIDSAKTLRVSNLVELSQGLQIEATDFAYIFRTYPDRPKEQSTLRINIREIVSKPGTPVDIALEPGDRLVVPNKSNYTEGYNIRSEGAFRNPQSYPIDVTKTLRISNLIELSQGLKVDATDFGYIFRTYPDKPKEQTYIRVNFREILANPGSAADLALEPEDRVVAMSKGLFLDQYQVRVSGFVRKPGSYIWDSSLKLEDVLTLAGGLKLEAARNKVEVFRVILNENRPTQWSAGSFEIGEDFKIKNVENFRLMPYDIIVVRSVPGYELQKMVTISGEVMYPGEYALISRNEKVASIVERAGGLSPESFPAGATLERDSIGHIILRLNKALKNHNNHNNVVLQAGDLITIPKQQDLVAIGGATNASMTHLSRLINAGGRINVAFWPGKRAKFYVKKYAAGFADDADRNNVTVERPNGEIKGTRHFLFFRIYPKVPKGSVVNVPVKPPKPADGGGGGGGGGGESKPPVDWDQIFAETMTKVTSILTLLLLVKNI